MYHSHKAFALVALTCLCLLACGSTSEGPSVGLDQLGNIVITGITGAECFGTVTITIDGLANPVVFPGPPQVGLAANVVVENGRVTIPVGPTATGRVEITDIRVEIPEGCAAMAGAFEYLGSTIELNPGETKEVAWSDFDED